MDPADLYVDQDDAPAHLQAMTPKTSSGELAPIPQTPPPRPRSNAAFKIAAGIADGIASTRPQLTAEELRERALRKEAKKRVAAKTGFVVHVAAWVATGVLLWIIWLVAGGPQNPAWPLIPIAGWGIGIAAHGASTWTFVHREFNIEKEMRKLEGRRSADD